MKALVIYDSFFGNTEQIARAIAAALGGPEDVRLARPGEVRPEDLAGFLFVVIGSPTRGFKASEAIQTFVNAIPNTALKGKKVAAFDTRIPASEVGRGLRFLMKVGGYAAPRIAKALQQNGGCLIMPPEAFFVKDKEGPLNEGELERAGSWGGELRNLMTKRS